MENNEVQKKECRGVLKVLLKVDVLNVGEGGHLSNIRSANDCPSG